MGTDLFEKVLIQLKEYTQNIALHVFGDPLCVSDLQSYLDLALRYDKKVHLTTTGYYIRNFSQEVFFHPSIAQINFSLNSFNKNNLKISLEDYLHPLIQLAQKKSEHRLDFFVNFRLWNKDDLESEKKFNDKVLKILNENFDEISQKGKSLRLGNKILVHFDNYFQWPSLHNTTSSDGTCHGLQSQLAILSDGTIVPCCLDGFGVINLGDIKYQTLDSILQSKKALQIIDGFKNNKAIEELCQKCTYKHRFDK
ncbi:MAG: SPASM domain-containing protein [Campylobacterales bacterium]|nr:SPASM domain-containing protein [Campylobacterales bacterium]